MASSHHSNPHQSHQKLLLTQLNLLSQRCLTGASAECWGNTFSLSSVDYFSPRQWDLHPYWDCQWAFIYVGIGSN